VGLDTEIDWPTVGCNITLTLKPVSPSQESRENLQPDRPVFEPEAVVRQLPLVEAWQVEEPPLL
jgi:hypothetical protein